MQAGVAEADAVIMRMPLESLAEADADAQVQCNLDIKTFYIMTLWLHRTPY